MQIQKLISEISQKAQQSQKLKQKLKSFQRQLPPLFTQIISLIKNIISSDIFKILKDIKLLFFSNIDLIVRQYQRELNKTKFRYQDQINFLQCEIQRQNMIIHKMKIQIQDIAMLMSQTQGLNLNNNKSLCSSCMKKLNYDLKDNSLQNKQNEQKNLECFNQKDKNQNEIFSMKSQIDNQNDSQYKKNIIRPTIDLLKLSTIAKTGLQTIQQQENSARGTQSKQSARKLYNNNNNQQNQIKIQYQKQSVQQQLQQKHLKIENNNNFQNRQAEILQKDSSSSFGLQNSSQIHTIQKDKNNREEVDYEPESTKQKNKNNNQIIIINDQYLQKRNFMKKNSNNQRGNIFEGICLSYNQFLENRLIEEKFNNSNYQSHFQDNFKSCLQNNSSSSLNNLKIISQKNNNNTFMVLNSSKEQSNSQQKQQQELNYISQISQERELQNLFQRKSKVYIKSKNYINQNKNLNQTYNHSKFQRYKNKNKSTQLKRNQTKKRIQNRNQINNSKQNINPNNFIQQFCVGSKHLEIKYQGQKFGSLRHGQGILLYSNGFCYEGQFNMGMRQGYGVLRFNFIQIYNGQWKYDKMNGNGKIRNCTVILNPKHTSRFLNPTSNNINQDHIFLLTKWTSYKGIFKNNSFNGRGDLRLQGGQRFDGIFENGLIVCQIMRSNINSNQKKQTLINKNHNNGISLFPNKTQNSSPSTSLKFKNNRMMVSLNQSRKSTKRSELSVIDNLI